MKKSFLKILFLSCLLNIHVFFRCSPEVCFYFNKIELYSFLFQDSIYFIILIVIFYLNILLVIFIREKKSKKNGIVYSAKKIGAKKNDYENCIFKTIFYVITQFILICICKIPNVFVSYYKFTYKIDLNLEKYVGLENIENVQLIYFITVNLTFLINVILNYCFNNRFKELVSFEKLKLIFRKISSNS